MSNRKVRNSLRRLRKGKRLSLRDAGDKMGIPFQTLANYETTENALPFEIVERAAKFYDVSETDITKEPAFLSEDAPPYRVTSIAIDLLPTVTLQLLKKIFSGLLAGSNEPETSKIMHSLFSITQELQRRPELIEHERRKPASSSVEVSQLAASSSAALAKVLPDDAASSGQSPEADEPPAHKGEQHGPSVPGSKPRHSGHGGKAQK